MKFGKQFEFHKIPEWSDNYLDYNDLKLLLKDVQTKYNYYNFVKKPTQLKKKLRRLFSNKSDKVRDNEEALLKRPRGESINIHDDITIISENNNENNIENEVVINRENILSIQTEENQKKFAKLFKEKVDIVDSFFRNELVTLKQKFLNLKNKMDNKKSSIIQSGNSIQNRRDSILKDSIKINIEKENAERDELGYAVSWKRAISQLYNLTSWLHSFCIINSIACQKILKKYNRVFKDQNLDVGEELNEYYRKLDFVFLIDDVIGLRRDIKKFYADELTEGDVKKAKIEIESRMQGMRTKDKTLIAFNLGMILALLFALCLMSFIPENSDTHDDSILVYFPPFNCVFVFILALFGVAINILVLKRYRINYIFIFEVDPHSRLGFNEIFKTGLFLLNVWLILIVFTRSSLSFDLFDAKFYIFPMIILGLYLVFILWPFHCFYFNFRKSILITLFRNIFPIGKNGVRFRDFMFGDILTSLTRPFASICLSFCLFTCEECREQNIRLDCNRNSIAALCLILAPFIIRLFQCLNRFYYTKMAWPHLGNALKYCGGIVYNTLSWMYGVYKEDYLYYFVISGIVANSYMLFWDIYMDWNLARSFDKNFFLRDKIIYPKWMYYFAIVINSLLRFTWLTSLPGVNLYISDESKVFILSVLEIYRRIQWSLFRIENENTNNPEKYRTILDIPKLPID